jgi:hypothetical protein
VSRDEGLFRGQELPRLLLLLAIAVAGWIFFIYLYWAESRKPVPAAARPIAETPPLPPPDDSPPFRGIEDRTGMTIRDNPAYAELLARARRTPPAELARISRRDVLFTHLIDDPQRYRGLPIHLQGTARRVEMLPVETRGIAPKGRLFEAWVVTPDSQGYPLILVFEDAPGTLPGGEDVSETVAFDGYFLKLKAYFAGDKRGRFAPLLIGRLTHIPHLDETAGGTSPRSMLWTFAPLALFVVYVAVRWTLHLRRALAPKPVRRRVIPPNDEIDPETLAAWAESPKPEDEEPGASG